MPHSLSTWTNDPASAALGSELRDTLEAALLELPENLRLVFVLRDMGGLSTEETAETLALGESAVKVRLHRARKRMRELLTDYLAK
jgi:RNA polymerase sigma-70 factor (ECF subfamily)